MTTLSEHRRSVGFLDHEGGSWSCFLVTYTERGGRWHGYFSFRPADGELDDDEIRTADIFIEDSEAEIHAKARGLGRPLLGGLLASALHTAERNGAGATRLRRAFRTLLNENAREISGAWPEPGSEAPPEAEEPTDEDRARLRSMYASYRLDQVAHFICLVDPDAFEEAVDRILDGEAIDFRARDRVQFAMMVVEHIEARLPLPPFEVWARDYLDNTDTYRLYAHTLHREGRLP